MDQNEIPEPDDHLRASEYGSLPVSLPELTHLTTQELAAFKSFINSQVREARKKSNQLLSKNEELRKLWMATLTIKVEGDPKIHRDAFQRALVRFPPVYLAYAYVTSLFVLDEAIRDEMTRRSKNT